MTIHKPTTTSRLCSLLFAAVVLAVPALTLSGCLVTLPMHTVRFETPETQGRFGKGFVGAGLARSEELTVVPSTTTVPPIDDRSFHGTTVLPVSFALGILRRLDVGLVKTNPGGSSPLLVRAKFQFLGRAGNEARKGDTSMAVTFGVGRGDESRTDTGGAISSLVKSSTSVIDMGIIVGHRVQNRLLVYGGMSFTRYGFQSTITQTVSNVTTPYDFDVVARQTGVNAGLQAAGGPFVLRLEGAWSLSSASPARRTGATVGLQLGFRW